MGGIDLDAEPGWRSNRGRVQDRDRLLPVLERHFRGRTVPETIAFCDANAIPASQVRTVDEVLFRQAGNCTSSSTPSTTTTGAA